MAPSSGKALLRLNSAICKQFHRTLSQPPLIAATHHKSSSVFSVNQYSAPTKHGSSLFGDRFHPSSLSRYSYLLDRPFSSLPLQHQESRDVSSGIWVPNNAYNEIVHYIHGTSESNEHASGLKIQVVQQVKLLNDDQILQVLSLLTSIQHKEKLHADLFNIIDNECFQRAKSWEPTKTFEALKKFNLLFPYYSSKFVKYCTNSWVNSFVSFGAQELLVYLLAVRRSRSFPPKLDREILEKRLSDVLEDLTSTELGTVCSCFFESKQGIRDVQLIDRLVQKLVENADEMDERTIGSMLKLFRKSSHDSTNYSKRVLDLQRILLPYVPKWGPMVLIQLASVGTNLLYFHHNTIERVTQKFVDCIETARVKDLERLAMVTSISCHRTPTVHHFWDLVELELVKSERRDEIHQYAHSFISLVSYAIMSKIFPEKLVKMALDPDIVQAALSIVESTDYNSTKRELLMLCCSLEIEHPGYDGPKLPAKELEKYKKLYQRPVPSNNQSKLTNHDRFLLTLHESTRALHRDATICYLQPHFISPDIVFTYNDTNARGSHLNTSEPKKFVLVAGSRNMYSRFRCSPMGPFSMKTRQLEALNYVTIPIPWFEFLPLQPNSRIAYLDKKIRTAASKVVKKW